MDKEQLLNKIHNLTIWKRESVRAPHKPLLVLLSLAILQREGKRLISYKEIESPLTKLLQEFGPSRKSYHPNYPYWRLREDSIWEIDNVNQLTPNNSGDVSITELRKFDVHAGFKKDVFELLIKQEELIPEIATTLLEAHFEPSLHEEILSAIGLSLEGYNLSLKNKRNPEFRDNVLSAYEYKCAVCNYDVRINNALVGLEAAHIKWHTANGPSTIDNGIALCSLHHKLFDYGIFTIDPSYRFILSEKATGSAGFSNWLLNYHSHYLNKPLRRDYEPNSEFIKWHQGQVFKQPARIF